MRTEKEMYELILQTAINDDRIIAVTIGGSRVNKNVSKDIFQDYDICYVVNELEPFISDDNWFHRFGEILIMGKPPGKEGYCLCLMQFTDGNRIDLSIYPKELSYRCIKSSLSTVLLDKNKIFPEKKEATDKDFHILKPTDLEFSNTCDEFWWVCPYVAKGLWREETLFALGALEEMVRPVLMRMLNYYIGIKTDFAISTGKFNKFLYKYLDEDIYEELLLTYTDAKSENIWSALFRICKLFIKISGIVSIELSYNFNKVYEQNVMNFVKHIKKLPKNTKDIY